MANVLKIKKYPEKILKAKCRPVEKITQREIQLFEDMAATMRHFSGIGLAAPQVGIERRMIVADVGDGPVKLANPKVIKAEGKDVMEEGCLSVPDTLVKIERPYTVVIRGLNEKGETVEIKAKGLLARVLMHEIDHLDGKLIVGYMGFLQKLKFKFRGNKAG